MIQKSKPILSVVSLTAALSVAGCTASDLPDIAPVTGTVTMDGQPLSGAQVVFAPEEGRQSAGVTDSNGQYQLTYIRATKGAELGKHRVRITTVRKTTSDREGAARVEEPIPAKYNANTTLTAEVEPGENTIDFALES